MLLAQVWIITYGSYQTNNSNIFTIRPNAPVHYGLVCTKQGETEALVTLPVERGKAKDNRPQQRVVFSNEKVFSLCSSGGLFGEQVVLPIENLLGNPPDKQVQSLPHWKSGWGLTH